MKTPVFLLAKFLHLEKVNLTPKPFTVMHKLFLLLSIVFLGHHLLAQDTLKRPSGNYGDTSLVKILGVIEKTTSSGKVLREVTFSYDFQGQSDVYISGLGRVPSKNSYTYLTTSSEIKFLSKDKSYVMARFDLNNTAEPMGAESVDLPKETDFPPQFRSDSYAPDTAFTEVLLTVIQKYFPSGFLPSQSGPINNCVTTYRNLAVQDPSLRGQLALKISQPYDVKSHKLTYRIQFIERDRPRLSDTWRYGTKVSKATSEASALFIETFLKELHNAQ
ncbi:hypothetical protein HB364_13525 [Pseudoflavitalea sp. X16]|uniref:hypothetical protein n=1 Tax=Paraflavitalea devenefica TaxID=2716334 RepID=UPI00141EE9CE|nr:hypothetical protein [Paraflavitalea devenefica]NII26109.1 hypothetical protein [Paraflavitalea devenefica]